MKTNSQKINWILDALLLCGFFVEFAMDWSGLPLHQWIGVFGGLLAVYHLVSHWEWVMAVSLRFFGKTSGQARTYLLLDLGLMLGFYLIVMSGLVISTWLNLPLTNYAAWVNFHILTSLVTLVLVVCKVGLHWRWIVRVARQLVYVPAPQPAPGLRSAPVPAPAVAPVTRRDFLKLMGIVGVASFLAFSSALKGEDELQNAAAAADATVANNETSAQAIPTNAPAATESLPESTAAPTTAAENVPVVETVPTAVPTTANAASASTACVVQCNKRCAAPGHCRRYQDTNGNNLCDLGECL